MTIVRFFCLLLIVTWGSPAAGQSGLAFLKVGPDARGLSMAEANVARPAGAYSTYWNPAGLAAPGANEAAMSHHRWVADVQTYAGAARFRLGEGSALGVSVVATSLGELEARTQPGDPDGLFTAQFISAGVSYGHAFGPLRLGGTAKYISERIFEESSNGYAFDFGAQLSLRADDIQLGAAVQHLGAMDELRVEATPLPSTFRAGISVKPFRVLADLDHFPLLNTVLTAEMTHRPGIGTGVMNEGETQFRIGGEAEVVETVFLRAGYMTNDALRRFSAGLGFEFLSFGLDYAFLPFESGFGGAAHVISLAYRW